MKKSVLFLILAIALVPLNLSAQEVKEKIKEYKIQIKDHKFTPDSLEIPQNQKVKLLIENLDSTIEEFESNDLKREKIVGGNKTIIVTIGPLKPGTYKFFGDFHAKTAKGVIVVK